MALSLRAKQNDKSTSGSIMERLSFGMPDISGVKISMKLTSF